MATYVIKVSLYNGEHAEFRVKNPRWIRFQELRSSKCYSLLCIKRRRYRDHVYYRTSNQRGFGSGNLNLFNKYRRTEDLFYIELYHDYEKRDGSESVERLVIERRDCGGVRKICDLHDFREESYLDTMLLDGFDTRLGPIYFNGSEYVIPEPED